MALQLFELDQLIEDTWRTDPFRTWTQRDDQMHYRSLNVKHDWQLEWLRDFYPRKLERIKKVYDDIRQGTMSPHDGETVEEYLKLYENKIVRLATKYRDALTEIRGRELSMFDRNPIGTTYYIDLDSGSDSADGLGTTTAWLTIEKYTTTTSRTPGDIAYVRANTSEPAGATVIAFDEDGTSAGRIYLIGCDATTNDPWDDNSDVKPQIDFGGSTGYVSLASDELWHLERLDIKSSTQASGYGTLNVSAAHYARLVNCVVRDRTTASRYGLLLDSSFGVSVEGCSFYDNTNANVQLTISRAILKDCIFNGGTATTDYGLMVINGSSAILINCDFGQTTAHDTYDVGPSRSTVLMYGCHLKDFDITASFNGSTAYWENCTFDAITPSTMNGANGFTTQFVGGLKSTTIPSGESGESIKMLPLQSGLHKLLSHGTGLGGFSYELGYPLRAWLAAGTYSIKVKIRADAAWTTYPTAEELFIRCRYYDSGSDYGMSEAVSDEVLDDGTDWVDFEVNITTGRAGPVYLDVFLGKYEGGGKAIHVFQKLYITES